MAVLRSQELDSSVNMGEVPVVWYNDFCGTLPSLEGKIAIVTGSNSGTGFWCAHALSRKGATVVLACRSLPKAEAAKAEIVSAGGKDVHCMQLDNMSFRSVRQFAADFQAKFPHLDILANNAGIMGVDEKMSEDGYDVQLQTNHLAHFLLTKLLWPSLLKAKGPARIVNHSSSGHWLGGCTFNEEQLEDPSYSCVWAPLHCVLWPWMMGISRSKMPNWRRYWMTKLCNVFFTTSLRDKIKEAGLQDKIYAFVAHPGGAATQLGIVTQQGGGTGPSLREYMLKQEPGESIQSAADGSMPLLMACVTALQSETDCYFGPGADSMEMKGPPKVCQIGSNAKDPQMAEQLWGFSERACKETFTI